VREWCADLYGPYPTGSVANPTGYVNDPGNPIQWDGRVIRGGGLLEGKFCRSASRYEMSPRGGDGHTGFRPSLGAIDTTAPVVTLAGSAHMGVELGKTYLEPGYSATDNVDGDLSSKVVVSGSVNGKAAGNYTLAYTVTDAAGNTGSTQRVVTVGAGNNLLLDFGSGIDYSAPTITLFTNSSKVGFTGTAEKKGMLAFGYFDEGVDVAQTAAGLNQANLSAFLGKFNVLAQASMETSLNGYLVGNPLISDAGTGKKAYLLVLAGVTSFANASQATEIALLRDEKTFGTIPAGSEPVPTFYSVRSLSYDTVVLGTEYLAEDASASFEAGWVANIYATQALAP
jgi:hypothetical protein